jgi:hypothetical protein
MSGEHAKKEMVTGEKPATSHGKAPSGECGNKVKGSPSHDKSRRSGEKKKKMKKVVYYETDSSSPSISGSDTSSVTSKRHERKKFSKIPLCYPRISKRTPLLSVPLGKPPMFDGEDYNMWSDKMRHHLTSLHASIWDVVEIGVQVPSLGDEDYDSDEVAQIRHFNSQATTILLASLSREEYNKVQGLKSAKEIWDVLKTTHEGDEVTKITKREMIEGELDRFMLHQGEEPQAIYNQLKTLVNQVRNLRRTKWDDHEMVKVILRSLVFLNPIQVQLIAKAKDLDVCNASISNLRDENAILHAKIVELKTCKPSTSTVEHVTICTRCRDINIDAIHDHFAMIKRQNDHIAKLDAKIAEHELENENFKFARSMLYSGRRPGIKDGIGFQQGDNVKLNAPPKRLSNFVKGKAPMPQDNEGYILYPVGYPEDKIRRIHAKKTHSHHAFIYKNEASSSRRSINVKMSKKKTPIASNKPNVSFKTFDASYVLTNKSGKVVAKYVGGKHKGSKTCVWVPKVLVSNVKGPKTVWVPKNKA